MGIGAVSAVKFGSTILAGLALWGLAADGARAQTRGRAATRGAATATTTTVQSQSVGGEFVPGRRGRGAPGAAAAAAVTTAAAQTTATADQSNATTGIPSLVDRLLAVGQSAGLTSGPAATTSGGSALVITLRGPLPEREQVVLFGAPTRSLNSVLSLLRRVRDDKDIGHLVVRMAGVSVGFAEAQEIRAILAEVRERGKKVTAVLEDESQVSYLIAAAAEEIVMPPSGGLALTGLRADGYFLKGLLGKIGVEAEFIHQGEYKAMGEIFEREGYSPAARRNMEQLVDSLYGEMVTVIASGRGMTAEEAKAAIDLGPATTSQALERRLADRALYTDDFLAEVRRTSSKVLTGEEYARQGRTSAADEIANPFALFMGMGRPGAAPRQDPAIARLPQVALVYANGSIAQGGSEEGFEETDAILSDDLLRTLEEVRKDKRVRAVLLRVNSPGGSAFASDLIWRKLRELDREKPVIASMGGVAASGGYYIAMAARKVYATSGTITGSIGVVGGKFSLAGTYERLGITKESIGRGAFSDLFSDTRLFNPQERTLLDRQMRIVYEDFLTKAADSRRLSREKMGELAEGRVWTGADARIHGLIDSTEGLAGAINEVKRQIGVKQEERIALVPYPRERTLFDLLSRVLSSSGGSGARLGLGIPSSVAGADADRGLSGEIGAVLSVAPPGLRSAITAILRVPAMLQRERVLLLMPMAVDIR